MSLGATSGARDKPDDRSWGCFQLSVPKKMQWVKYLQITTNGSTLFYLYFFFKCTCEFLMRSYPVQFRGWENLGQRLKWVYSSENSYLLMEHTRTLEAKRILFSIKMEAWIIDVVDRCQGQQLRTEDEFRCHIWCQGQNRWQELMIGAKKKTALPKIKLLSVPNKIKWVKYLQITTNGSTLFYQ